MENDTGTDATKAIVALDFYAHKTKDLRLNAKAFSKTRKLRYLQFDYSGTIKWRGNPLKYMPINELRFLEWSGFQSKSWPSSFQPKNLTVLRMPGSRIKQLWMGSMVLPNLKEFDLSSSKNLIETPDLTGAPNLERINLGDCRSLCEVHPSIGSLKKLRSLHLAKCSSLEKLPDLSNLECLSSLFATETVITQLPSVNLRPKISNDDIFGVRFSFSGSKLMGLKSRDPIYDIGSLVEYQKEGTYESYGSLEAAWIDFDSKGENILDMAGGVVWALDDDLKMIGGWSLGFHIPEWVEYKSNGSSVKIDLDANTNLEMGCAFFIVCDSDQFFSNDQLDYTSISELFKTSILYTSNVRLTIVFETDEEYCVELDYSQIPLILKDSFGKQIGFWMYIPAVLRFLDIRRVIKISFETELRGRVAKQIEVKECGVHLVCPDDANSNFFNSIAPFGRSGSSSNSDVHRRFVASMRNNRTRNGVCCLIVPSCLRHFKVFIKACQLLQIKAFSFCWLMRGSGNVVKFEF